jgi:hypothetical protein
MQIWQATGSARFEFHAPAAVRSEGIDFRRCGNERKPRTMAKEIQATRFHACFSIHSVIYIVDSSSVYPLSRKALSPNYLTDGPGRAFNPPHGVGGNKVLPVNAGDYREGNRRTRRLLRTEMRFFRIPDSTRRTGNNVFSGAAACLRLCVKVFQMEENECAVTALMASSENDRSPHSSSVSPQYRSIKHCWHDRLPNTFSCPAGSPQHVVVASNAASA